jgi:2',3'-cyclic-nucleotide 2'-phosphodiesterase (5'-nucleotidase family)
VDTGDLFGTYPGKLLDISAWRGMEISGYDLFLPGDQDFMYGHAFLDSLTKGSSVSLLKGCLSDYYFVPDKLIKKKGITFGFLGYHGDESRADFPDEVKKMWLNPDIGEEIEKIAGKCDRVIILSHAGVDENIRLAKSITGVDVIIGGHTQEVVDTLVNGIRIVQPGADAERVGVLVFGDKGTNPVRIANKMIIMDDKIPRDTLIYNMVSDKKVRKE